MTRLFGLFCVFLAQSWLVAHNAAAAEATVAVAANFRAAALQMAAQIERETGHRYTIVSGSTGKLTAQLLNGAPFDVLLAADMARPRRLAQAGLVSDAGVRRYAIGRLALWRPGSKSHPDLADTAPTPESRLAVANPKLAPYGAAAMSWLQRDARRSSWMTSLVFADNAGGAHALVASGAAGQGVVALSTLLAADVPAKDYRLIPVDQHDVIEQGAVLLLRSEDNPAARYWFDWLTSNAVISVLPAAGYAMPPESMQQ